MSKRSSHLGSRKVRAVPVAALRRIRLFATDVDGVLTDGGMYLGNSGEELKRFHVHDGMGLKLLQQAGIITAIVTQERTKLVASRAAKLDIPEVHQGVTDKFNMVKKLAEKYHVSLNDVAYMGDDVNDMETLRHVGFSATPANGVRAVKAIVDYVCAMKGGDGAVREVIDLILDGRMS